jgi:hypothetical protein
MTVLFPARYWSLKTLFTMVRETAKMSTHAAYSISGRTNIFGDTRQWYLSTDGKNIPSTPVKSNTEAAA